MAILKGIFVGALSAPLAVASVGAFLGLVGGWAPCHGVPFSVGGAYFGSYIFLTFFGPASAIVGAIVGGVAGSRAKPAGPAGRQRRRWSLGRCMAIIALTGLLLAMTRPLVVWPDGDGAEAESATVVPAP